MGKLGIHCGAVRNIMWGGCIGNTMWGSWEYNVGQLGKQCGAVGNTMWGSWEYNVGQLECILNFV